MNIGDIPISGLSPRDFSISPPAPEIGAIAARGDKALVKAAKDFESVLLHKLLQEMKDTIPDSGLTGGSEAKQVQGIFWSFLAQDIADKGGLGLWKDLYEQWSAQAADSSERIGDGAESGAAIQEQLL